MHADTDAIRGYTGATAELCTDLRAAAALLTENLGPTVAAAFGPVGTRFAAALADAAAGLLADVTRISDELDGSGTAMLATADRYDDAEERAQAHIAWAGM
jgi:hypothetical protein